MSMKSSNIAYGFLCHKMTYFYILGVFASVKKSVEMKHLTQKKISEVMYIFNLGTKGNGDMKKIRICASA